jgi:hypothetical protein
MKIRAWVGGGDERPTAEQELEGRIRSIDRLSLSYTAESLENTL